MTKKINPKGVMPVLTSEQQKQKPLKRTKIRYTEYYDLQNVLDNRDLNVLSWTSSIISKC